MEAERKALNMSQRGVRQIRPRIIPVLLLKDGLLYKSIKFKNKKYVGDPRNTVRIFNEKGVDELVVLDISDRARNEGPDYTGLRELASQAFMPLAFGGGIRSLEQAKRALDIGVEKIVICTAAAENPNLIEEISRAVGSSSVMVCIDIKKDFFGRRRVTTRGGSHMTSLDPVRFARTVEAAGAGELIVQSVDRDGTMSGYDLADISRISDAVGIPVVALGGGGNLSHIATAIDHGAAAAAAGSMFVFQGQHRAVLITYPQDEDLDRLFGIR